MHEDTLGFFYENSRIRESCGERLVLVNEGFKAAEARYTAREQVNTQDLARWLAKARDIQWDYKNIVRSKGQLERLK